MGKWLIGALLGTMLFLLGGAALRAETFKTIDNSEVKRNNPGGSYDFTEKVDGKSVVVIRASGGSVKFSSSPKFLDEGSKIDGKSKVLLEAERITFNGKIDGEAVVLIIVSKGGKIEFNEKIDGRVQVYWCKADDKDEQPTVKGVRPNGRASCNQVSRAQMDKLIREHDLN